MGKSIITATVDKGEENKQKVEDCRSLVEYDPLKVNVATVLGNGNLSCY